MQIDQVLCSMMQIQQTYAIRLLQGVTFMESEAMAYDHICQCVEQYAKMIRLNLIASNLELENQIEQIFEEDDEESD